MGKPPIPPAVAEQALALLRSGRSPTEVARELAGTISRAAIYLLRDGLANWNGQLEPGERRTKKHRCRCGSVIVIIPCRTCAARALRRPVSRKFHSRRPFDPFRVAASEPAAELSLQLTRQQKARLIKARAAKIARGEV